MKTFTIYSLGCKVNQYDGQLLREHFLAAGYVEQSDPWHAGADEDVFVLNTCTVTAEADKECAYLLRKVARLRPAAKIIVTGCGAGAKDQDLLGRQDVDLFVPNDKKGELLDLYAAMMGQDTASLPPTPGSVQGFQGHCRAFVKIQDGCNEFCTFCKIPYVRGRNRSRSVEDVRREVSGLAQNGYQEIVLTGVHAGNFGWDSMERNVSANLADLVGALHDIAGVERIRFSSLEPMNVSHDLIQRLSKYSKVCPHFHLPLQSGDDVILRSMRRRYTAEQYRRMAMDLHAHFADLEITTDIIVGFPGETRAQFDNTLRLVKEVQFLKVHVFPYSDRPGTVASAFADKVPAQEIAARAKELTELSEATAQARRQRYAGRVVSVLVEGKSNAQGFHAGFTPNYLKVLVPNGAAWANRIIEARVTSFDDDSLYAEPIAAVSPAVAVLPKGY